MKIEFTEGSQFRDKWSKITCSSENAEDLAFASRFCDLVVWLWGQFFAEPDKIWRAFCKGRLELVIRKEVTEKNPNEGGILDYGDSTDSW